MANDGMLMAWGDESAKMRHNPPMYPLKATSRLPRHRGYTGSTSNHPRRMAALIDKL